MDPALQQTTREKGGPVATKIAKMAKMILTVDAGDPMREMQGMRGRMTGNE